VQRRETRATQSPATRLKVRNLLDDLQNAGETRKAAEFPVRQDRLQTGRLPSHRHPR